MSPSTGGMALAALPAAAAVVVAISVPLLYRIYRGPTIQDRVLGLNVLGTSTVVVLALVGVAFDVPGVLDVAIVYAVLNFTTSIAVARLVGPGGV